MELESRVYTHSFRAAQQGHAVYPKTSSKVLAPGACVYMNGNHDWTQIVLLTDHAAIKSLGLEPPINVSSKDDDGYSEWEAKISKGVVANAITMDAKAM
jgi:hypothetical protein